jgi:hypothetical protein
VNETEKRRLFFQVQMLRATLDVVLRRLDLLLTEYPDLDTAALRLPLTEMQSAAFLLLPRVTTDGVSNERI